MYICSMYVVWYAGKKENCAKCKIAMYDKMKHYGSDIFKTFFFLGGPSYHFFVITENYWLFEKYTSIIDYETSKSLKIMKKKLV